MVQLDQEFGIALSHHSCLTAVLSWMSYKVSSADRGQEAQLWGGSGGAVMNALRKRWRNCFYLFISTLNFSSANEFPYAV